MRKSSPVAGELLKGFGFGFVGLARELWRLGSLT